jgi:hypothetical protein
VVHRTLLLVIAGCAVHAPPPAPAAPEPPRDRERHYTIWLGGARVGTAIEREIWSADGVRLVRDETLAFFRGDAPVRLATRIEIDADRALVPIRVSWTSAPAAPATRTRAELGDAIPAELVPLLVRRDGGFAGRVVVPARGFLAGAGRIQEVQPGRFVAQLALDGGAVAEATLDFDRDGDLARVVDGEGVIAIRATAAQASAAFQPVDLIAATAIPIAGPPSRTLVVDASAIPGVPGQLARPIDGGMAVELSAELPGELALLAPGRERTRDITALVRAVRRQITPTLAAGAGSPRIAERATAGDCTTFALAYAALAAARGIPTRLVTGLRVDGPRLVRHRWAVSWTGRAWIAVDAAYGAVPAGGDLVGLAVHAADDAGLVAGEAALARIRSAAWQ